MLLEQFHRQHQQVVEVERIGLFQAGLIQRIKASDLLRSVIVGGILVGPDRLVLGPVDRGRESARLERFLLDVALFEQGLEQTLLVLVIVN